MRREIFAVILSFICILLLSSFHFSSGILQMEDDQETLQEEVTVTLKLIQVYVTDKEGNPVLDLEKSDFVLYDSGKLKTITDFEKHVLAKSDIEAEEKKAPDSAFRTNRKFLILLDILQNDQVGIVQSKKAALHFINTQLQPGDEVGIISYTPLSGLNIHIYLTSNLDKIKKAIQNAKEIPISKENDPYWYDLRQKEEQEARARRGFTPEAESLIKSWLGPPEKTKSLRDIKKNPIDQTREVTELAKALRYIPGIKHIMFFSGGGNPKLHKLFERLGMELADANCIVHTINSMGTRSNFLGPYRPGTESLEILAKTSGGKFFEDVSDYDAISDDIQNLSGNYYVLGYYIDEKWDGRYHKIKIEVNQDNCHVFAQGGYFNPKPFYRFSEFEKKLHLIDLALSDKPYFQDPIEIPLVAMPCSNKTEFNCILLSKLPIDYLDKSEGQKLELINFILDEEKIVIDSSRGEVDYSKLFQGDSYQYSIVSLNPGKYECRIIARNLTTGKGGVGSSAVTIPEYQDSGVILFTPLILIPHKKSQFLKLSMIGGKIQGKEDIALNHIYPFSSSEYSPLIEELDPQTSRISAVLRYTVINIQKPEIDLYANIVDETTEDEIPLDFSLHSSEIQENTHVLYLDITLPELKPGKYSLEFLAAEKTTKSVVSASKPFKIK